MGETNESQKEFGSPTQTALKILRQKVEASAHQRPESREGDPGERILRAIDDAIEQKIRGDNCWDWAEKVYVMAGLSVPSKKNVVYSSVGTYKGRSCGNHCASDALLDSLQPGDWIFINNKNKRDPEGNHSVLFMGWEDREKRIAKGADCAIQGGTGKINLKNLKDKPVTAIIKPIERIRNIA